MKKLSIVFFISLFIPLSVPSQASIFNFLLVVGTTLFGGESSIATEKKRDTNKDTGIFSKDMVVTGSAIDTEKAKLRDEYHSLNDQLANLNGKPSPKAISIIKKMAKLDLAINKMGVDQTQVDSLSRQLKRGDSADRSIKIRIDKKKAIYLPEDKKERDNMLNRLKNNYPKLMDIDYSLITQGLNATENLTTEFRLHHQESAKPVSALTIHYDTQNNTIRSTLYNAVEDEKTRKTLLAIASESNLDVNSKKIRLKEAGFINNEVFDDYRYRNLSEKMKAESKSDPFTQNALGADELLRMTAKDHSLPLDKVMKPTHPL
jgi:hypothetical protein